jgi:hypothetical protein
MLNIFSYKENANQSYTEIPSHLSQIGNCQENIKAQMVVRMQRVGWRKEP